MPAIEKTVEPFAVDYYVEECQVAVDCSVEWRYYDLVLDYFVIAAVDLVWSMVMDSVFGLLKIVVVVSTD